MFVLGGLLVGGGGVPIEFYRFREQFASEFSHLVVNLFFFFCLLRKLKMNQNTVQDGKRGTHHSSHRKPHLAHLSLSPFGRHF